MQRNILDRLYTVCRAVACAAMLAVCVPLAYGGGDHAPPDKPGEVAEATAVPEGELVFYDHKASPADLGGWYAHDGAIVTFRVESWTAGAKSAAGDEPDKVAVQFDVNGAPIEHVFDYAAQSVAIDGYGVAFDVGDVMVLRAFHSALEKSLYVATDDFAAKDAELPRAQDALYRLATMYSEAPVGMALGQRVVTAPTVSYAAPEKRKGLPLGDAADDAAQAKACQADGGEGIAYLYEPCSAARARWSAHDANHCYSHTIEMYGENQPSCPGRCGPGCGLFGSGNGPWTNDCHDHDMCVTYHGNTGCGDEWNEAADDFLFAWPAC